MMSDNQDVQNSAYRKILVLVVVLAIVAIGFYLFAESLSLSWLAERETQLREYQAASPVLIFGLAFAAYVFVSGSSLPGGATVLTLFYGWYFGWLKAVVLVSFASTAGATVAFLLSRYLIGDWVQAKFGNRLASINREFEKEGPFYLLTLRLVPLVPFFLVNHLMGLTKVRTSVYWLVSQVGMFPATCVYVYAGSRVPNLKLLAEDGPGAVFTATQLTQITLAFVALGMLPTVSRLVVKLIRKRVA